VTIGAYDGIHLGHHAILSEVQRQAGEAGISAAVLSFEPMPKEFFAAENPPARLTRFREKFELLDALGIDELFCPRFSAVRDMSADEFIHGLLADSLRARRVVVGEDFRFAARRKGRVADLERAGLRLGFEVTTVPAVFWRDRRISSTDIRLALRRGDLETARGMLGRDYSMSGRVVRGLGLGRKLGFPTANLDTKGRVLPPHGVYAVHVNLAEQAHRAVLNLGLRPTLRNPESRLRVEAHLLDFQEDLYGRELAITFVAKLRDEVRFHSVEELQRQIGRDVQAARKCFHEPTP